MEISGLIVAGIACVSFVLINKWKELGSEDEFDNSNVEHQKRNEVMIEETNVKTETVVSTRDLLLDTLTKIGCQYELGEGEDDRIYFAYQGENFMVDTSDNSPYIVIWDTYWHGVELYDIEEVSRMKKAINYANFNTLASTIYTINEDGKTMDVHCRSMVPFFNQIPEIDLYLKSQLNDFFRAHQYVGNELLRLRTEEQNA